MMLLFLLLITIFNKTSSLQCTNNCSMIYSMNQKYILPKNCSLISTNRCSVKLTFWYQRGSYIVTYPGDLLNDQYLDDNKHFIMIEASMRKFFSYEINHVCKEEDDCARKFAENKIHEMKKRFFNLPNIYMDLQKVLYRKNSLHDDLFCFDSNDAVRQCAIHGTNSSCQIIDDLIKHKLHRRSCHRSSHSSASVNIYDTGSFSMMTVKCNRMLCNGPLTTEAVKKILYRHNITDIHGRLPAKSSHLEFKLNLFLLGLFVIFFSNK